MSEFLQWLAAFVSFFGLLGLVMYWDAKKGRKERRERERIESNGEQHGKPNA